MQQIRRMAAENLSLTSKIQNQAVLIVYRTSLVARRRNSLNAAFQRWRIFSCDGAPRRRVHQALSKHNVRLCVLGVVHYFIVPVTCLPLTLMFAFFKITIIIKPQLILLHTVTGIVSRICKMEIQSCHGSEGNCTYDSHVE